MDDIEAALERIENALDLAFRHRLPDLSTIRQALSHQKDWELLEKTEARNRYLAGELAIAQDRIEKLEAERDLLRNRVNVLQVQVNDAARAGELRRQQSAAWQGLAEQRQGRIEKLEAALLKWWNDPDNPPVLVAALAASLVSGQALSIPSEPQYEKQMPDHMTESDR